MTNEETIRKYFYCSHHPAQKCECENKIKQCAIEIGLLSRSTPALVPLDVSKIGSEGRLGAYLNTLVSDLNIVGKGQYLRDLFSQYDKELAEYGQPAMKWPKIEKCVNWCEEYPYSTCFPDEMCQACILNEFVEKLKRLNPRL